jgi:hypothetical protein
MTPTNEVRAVPTLSCNPYSTVIYYAPINSSGGHLRRENSLNNLKENQAKGILSNSAKKRLRNAVGWLILRVAHKMKRGIKKKKQLAKSISFITLTLPSQQQHSDNQIKSECLNQFLQELRTTWKLKEYVWRAESQQNGNIHFHIVTDVYVPHADIRSRWNRIINKLGYVDRFRENTGKFNPPSTEITSLKKVHKIDSYISKYCTKNETNRPLDGRLWFASETLQSIVTPSVQIDSAIDTLISQVIAEGTTHVFYGEHATILAQSIFKRDFLPDSSIIDIRRQFIQLVLFDGMDNISPRYYEDENVVAKATTVMPVFDTMQMELEFPFCYS